MFLFLLASFGVICSFAVVKLVLAITRFFVEMKFLLGAITVEQFSVEKKFLLVAIKISIFAKFLLASVIVVKFLSTTFNTSIRFL